MLFFALFFGLVIASDRIIVTGGGPAGMFTAINLVQAGKRVLLIEKAAEEIVVDRPKSWRFGISKVGRSALEAIPGLWEKLEKNVVKSEYANIRFGGIERKLVAPTSTLDRNELVLLLLQFLKDMPQSKQLLQLMFETEVLYVDGQNRQVICKNLKSGVVGKEIYQILVGADGAYSAVRNTLFSKAYDYECSQSSIFTSLKSIYVTAPPDLQPDEFYLFPNVFKGGNIVMLPAGSGEANMVLLAYDNHALDDELLTDDPMVMCNYLRSRNKVLSFNMQSCQKIVDGVWSRSQQVTCSPYVLGVKCGAAVLIGDAAHCTSPNGGQGLNTALVDVKVLVEELTCNTADQALQNYQAKRLKVGHAVTYFSFNINSLSTGRMAYIQIKNNLRNWASKISHGWIHPAPLDRVADEGLFADEGLIEAFAQGDIQKTAAINQKIVEETHWRNVGILPQTQEGQKAVEQRKKMFELRPAEAQVKFQ